MTRWSVSVPGCECPELGADLLERVGAVEAVRVRVGAGVAQRLDLVEPLGLLGGQAAACGVLLDVGFFVTHKGMTVLLRRH